MNSFNVSINVLKHLDASFYLEHSANIEILHELSFNINCYELGYI